MGCKIIFLKFQKVLLGKILGWREYVRGIYWLKMPFYKEENYLEAQIK